MPRPRPPHLQHLKTRHGKMIWVVQVGRGAPKVQLTEAYGTPEFEEEYRDAVAVSSAKRATPKNRNTAGTLEWGWMLYKQSKAWGDLSPATHRQRENIMINVLKNGNHPLSSITRAALIEGLDRRKDTPSAARNFLDMMRGMFQWLLSTDVVKYDPTAGLKVKRPKTKGFAEWSYDQILHYENSYPLGTRERVMFDVYLYTGLRRGDAARVGPGHVRPGVDEKGNPIDVITLATEKGQGEILVHLPVLDVLKRTLAAGPTGPTSFIVNTRGKPYVKESLGNAFKDACVAIKIMNRSAHGLRKAAATRAADNGATVHQLMAIFGWITIKQAEVYTRQADRKRLAMQAMSKLG